jgi:hypothetical protein
MLQYSLAYNYCCRLFEGVTRDTGEEFDLTVDNWDATVKEPLEDFLHRVFCTYFFSHWLRLPTDSLCLAPEICASVALYPKSQSRSAMPASLVQPASHTGTPIPGAEPAGRPTARLTSRSIAASSGLHKLHSNDVEDIPTQPPPTKANLKSTPNLQPPAAKKLSAYEIQRDKNIAVNKMFLDKVEGEVLKNMGIGGPLPPLFPEKEAKKKKPRTKRPPAPAEQLRRGRSAAQETS